MGKKKRIEKIKKYKAQEEKNLNLSRNWETSWEREDIEERSSKTSVKGGKELKVSSLEKIKKYKEIIRGDDVGPLRPREAD